MTEDDRYRTSSQFRLWSYTTQSLYTTRSSTNQIAAERVREAVRRVRETRANTPFSATEVEHGKSAAIIPEGDIECLTVEEELKLVTFFCRQTMQLADHLKVPTDVKVIYVSECFVNSSRRYANAVSGRRQQFNTSSAST